MDRRTFSFGFSAALTTVLITHFAQAQDKIWRIGMLETTSATLNASNLDAFRQRLRELGYVEGRNLVIEYRASDGRGERFTVMATELVAMKVDLIVARGSIATKAAKAATDSIPVVMATTGEPLLFVSSLRHPGGNITGVSSVTVDLEAKRFGLLRELVPTMARVAALYNMSNPSTRRSGKRSRQRPGRLGSALSSSTCATSAIWRARSSRQIGTASMGSSWGKMGCSRPIESW